MSLKKIEEIFFWAHWKPAQFENLASLPWFQLILERKIGSLFFLPKLKMLPKKFKYLARNLTQINMGDLFTFESFFMNMKEQQ